MSFDWGSEWVSHQVWTTDLFLLFWAWTDHLVAFDYFQFDQLYLRDLRSSLKSTYSVHFFNHLLKVLLPLKMNLFVRNDADNFLVKNFELARLWPLILLNQDVNSAGLVIQVKVAIDFVSLISVLHSSQFYLKLFLPQ